MKVLVLGAGGMLGHTLFAYLGTSAGIEVTGTVRSASVVARLPAALQPRLLAGVDVEHVDSLHQAFASVRPDVVINCIGVVKQLAAASDPLVTLPLNALLPHRLARLCAATGARLIHISTDCVFSGARGMYREDDPADALDMYGRSKHVGEVDYPHAVTLRTSIIGHELQSAHGLVEWFLAQAGPVKGYRRAVFSGLPTVELSRVIRDIVMPRPALCGVYHVAAAPINKYDLLRLVAAAYGRATEIRESDDVVIDRSLDGGRFREATGYRAPAWPALIKEMKAFG